MQIEILQDGTGNYLQISGVTGESFSDKIFLYQDIYGFLPMEIRRINGKKEYIYNISGKISLEQYLMRQKNGIREIRRVFEQIFSILKTAEEYLLDTRGVVIEIQVMYFDPVSEELATIYQAESEKNPVLQIGRLLEDIMELMSQEDKELVFFVYGMHKMTKEAGCTWKKLLEYVQKGEWSQENSSYKDKRNDDKNNGDKNNDNRVTIDSVRERYQYLKEKKSERRKETRQGNSQLKRGNPGDHKGSFIHQNQSAVQVIRAYGIPLIFFLGIIIIYIFLYFRGVFQKPVSGELDWAKAVGTLFFMFGVSGYGIWKSLDKKRARNGIIYHAGEKEKKKVCLIPQRGGSEPIFVPYFPFSIDRLQIFQEAGNVLIMDEESDSGTYFNGKKLVPWSRTEIQDGDVIQISDQSYVVEITMAHFIL